MTEKFSLADKAKAIKKFLVGKYGRENVRVWSDSGDDFWIYVVIRFPKKDAPRSFRGRIRKKRLIEWEIDRAIMGQAAGIALPQYTEANGFVINRRGPCLYIEIEWV